MNLGALHKSKFYSIVSFLGAIASLIALIPFLPAPERGFLAHVGALFAHPVVALLIIALVLCLLISVAFLSFSVAYRRISATYSDSSEVISGRRLFQYEGLYPIDITDSTNTPSLNPDIFAKALHYFAVTSNDRLAAMDLVYLREDTRLHSGEVLRRESENDYKRLIEKYDLGEFSRTLRQETDSLLRNVIQIVNDIGATLEGTHSEILLHDVRNPLRSVIAAQNTEHLSRHRLHDPSTRFVVEYLKNQGRFLLNDLKEGSKVAYPKQFTQSTRVKATTIPIYDRKYGLIAILCFNIDIETIGHLKPGEQRHFFELYAKTYGETPEFEKHHAPQG